MTHHHTAHAVTPGHPLPDITVPRLGGGQLTLGRPEGGRDWAMVVVYRGKHCPLCHKYLGQLQSLLADYHALGVDVAVVSGDPQDRAHAMADEVGLTMPVGHDLSLEQMRTLGLYVSDPRTPQETDRPYPEPAVFVVNDEGNLQVVDISNAPFARPDLSALHGGLKFIRDNAYPVRGTRAA